MRLDQILTTSYHPNAVHWELHLGDFLFALPGIDGQTVDFPALLRYTLSTENRVLTQETLNSMGISCCAFFGQMQRNS